MAMNVDLAPGDTLVIGKGTRIRLERKTGQRARLVIDSPDDVSRIKAGTPVPTQPSLTRTAAGTTEAPRSEPRPLLTRQTPGV